MLSSLIRVLAVQKQGGLIIVGKFSSRLDSDHVGSFAVITPELFFQHCGHRNPFMSDYVVPGRELIARGATAQGFGPAARDSQLIIGKS